MVSEIVTSVLSDNTNRRITIQEAAAQIAEEKPKKEPKKRTRKPAAPKEKKQEEKSAEKAVEGSGKEGVPVTGETDLLVGQLCPVCGKGTIIKGKAAYGCSEWKNGCTLEGHSIEIALQLLGSFARFMDVRRASRNCVTIVS